MYICNDCKAVFETADTEQQNHPYGMGYAVEKYCVCPYCGSTNFSEAYKCLFCGEYVAELDDGMCAVCQGDVYGK